MMIYSQFGFSEFVVALGYKGDYIKRWMTDYASMTGDLTISTRSGAVAARRGKWRAGLAGGAGRDGDHTQTGGRIKRLQPKLLGGTFCLTWGDGVSDIDIPDLLRLSSFPRALATVTAVRPPARFGHLEFEGDQVRVIHREAAGRRGLDQRRVLRAGAPGLRLHRGRRHALRARAARAPRGRRPADGLQAQSFWQCMDTLRDLHLLQRLWDSGEAPWKPGVI
jgi:glucose-1-phosphate cytidylyltransferase